MLVHVQQRHSYFNFNAVHQQPYYVARTETILLEKQKNVSHCRFVRYFKHQHLVEGEIYSIH